MSEIILNGDSYVRFPSDDKLFNKKTVFVGVDLNLLDWNQDGSSQIVGNFNGQGYGLFYHKGFENVLDYTIVDKGNDHLFYFNEDGGLVSQRNFPALTEEHNFTVMLVDHTDSKYYFDQANNTCFKFDSNNLYVLDFTIPSGVISVMDVDSSGNIYFMDTLNQVIHKYSSLGVFTSTLTPTLNAHNNMVIKSNGDIETFFSREGTHMLTDSLGNYYTLWGANIYRNGLPWFFVSPQTNNIGIDLEDNIWVIYNNNRVLKVNPNGRIIFDRLFHNIVPCEEASCPPKPSKADSVGLGFTKRGDGVVARVVLNRSGYTINLDEDGEVIGCEHVGNLLDVEAYPSVSYKNTDLLTNGDFTGYFARKRFNNTSENSLDSKVQVKVAIQDPCNSEVHLMTLTSNVTSLKSGLHNLTFIFDGSKGIGSLIIDGIVVDQFEQKGYIYYVDDNRPPYLVGADSGNFRARQEEIGVLNKSYLTGTIENLTISSSLDERQFNNVNLTDINFEFPVQNHISFKERVDKLFLFRPVGMKSAQYDIKVKNTKVTDEPVRDKIELDIRSEVNEKSPVHTNLKEIVWKDEIRFKDLV